VRREQIEALLAEKSQDELGPQSVNHLLASSAGRSAPHAEWGA
jgi:hypothetical protein